MGDAAGPWFPEFDYEPEERLAAVAEILLRGVQRMQAERKRQKTRRWRERSAGARASNRVDVPGETSPPRRQEVVGCDDG